MFDYYPLNQQPPLPGKSQIMAAIFFDDLLLFHNDNNPLIEVEPL